jgi:hypothetical protein
VGISTRLGDSSPQDRQMAGGIEHNGKAIQIKMAITVNYPGFDIRTIIKRGDDEWRDLDQLNPMSRNAIMNILKAWVELNWR